MGAIRGYYGRAGLVDLVPISDLANTSSPRVASTSRSTSFRSFLDGYPSLLYGFGGDHLIGSNLLLANGNFATWFWWCAFRDGYLLGLVLSRMARSQGASSIAFMILFCRVPTAVSLPFSSAIMRAIGLLWW